MMEETVPEIQRTALSSTVLYLKVLGIHDVIGFDFFEAPALDQMEEALLLLHALQALDDSGKITPAGRSMSRFPLEPCLAKMLLHADTEGCLEECLAVAAMVSTEPIWYKRRVERGTRDEEAEAAHQTFFHESGDHLTLLQVWRRWDEEGHFSEDWLREHFLRTRAMRLARHIYKQLKQEVKTAGLRLQSVGRKTKPVLRSLVAGFFVNAARRMGQGMYKLLAKPGAGGNGAVTTPSRAPPVAYLHPGAALLARQSSPGFVVYHELICTAKPFVRTATAVDYEWLQECRGPMTKNVSAAQLCGREEEASQHQGAEEDNAARGTQSPAVQQAPASAHAPEDAVAAARARYLARKKQSGSAQ